MATFLQLCAKLTTRSGAIGTAPASVVGQTGRQALCVEWIKQAWEDVQRLHDDWSFLQGEWSGALSAGDSTYSASDFSITRFGEWKGDRHYPVYPSGVYRPTSLYVTATGVSDEGSLRQISYEAWRAHYARGSQTNGRPTSYAFAPDQTIRFGPIPDKSYTAKGEYRKSPQTLAVDADEPDMPSRFHDIIVHRALILIAERDRIQDTLLPAVRGYESMLVDMRRDLLPEITTPFGR